MHCFLEAGGRCFDVDKFLAESPWRKRADVIRRGDVVRGRVRRKLADVVKQESTIQVQVTSREGAYEKLEPAVRAPTRFLRRWENETERLRRSPGITWMRLRFGIKWPEKFVVIERTFPGQLVALAGKNKIDLHLSVYWAQAWRPQDEERDARRGQKKQSKKPDV